LHFSEWCEEKGTSRHICEAEHFPRRVQKEKTKKYGDVVQSASAKAFNKCYLLLLLRRLINGLQHVLSTQNNFQTLILLRCWLETVTSFYFTPLYFTPLYFTKNGLGCKYQSHHSSRKQLLKKLPLTTVWSEYFSSWTQLLIEHLQLKWSCQHYFSNESPLGKRKKVMIVKKCFKV